jgi:Yip1-like protein
MSYSASFPTEAVSEPPPGFAERFTGMMVRPRETLARLQEPDAWFWPAILFLAGYTLFYLAAGLGAARYQASLVDQMLSQPNRGSLPPGFDSLFRGLMPASQIFAMVMSVPLTVAWSWAVRTGLFYGLATILGGAKPALGRVVAMVGWAWVPLFFQYMLLGLLMLTLPQVLAFFVPTSVGEATRDPGAAMRTQWQGQLFIYLSPFVVWNLVLCVIGVSQLFELPRWKAAIVVLLPAVGQILFQGAMYLLAVNMMNVWGPTMPGTNPPNPTIPNGP